MLELASGIAGAYCGKALADLGATVTKVESPEGDAMRHAGPFAGDGPHVERSTPFLWLNTGKRSVTLRLDDPADFARLRGLAATADVLVLDQHVDVLGADGAGVDLLADAPDLVVVRVTPFGETGPHADWQSSPLVQYAMACWMHMTGRPDREPLASGGMLSEVAPGLAAAGAALMALHGRDFGGASGQQVEVAQQEVLALMQPYVTLGLAYSDTWRPRSGMPFPMTVVPAADGWLGINVLTQSQWEMLCALSGETELLTDSRFGTPIERSAHAPELTERFSRWAAQRPRAETFVEGQHWRVPLGFVAEIPELPDLEQHRARQFFVDVDHPEAGRLRYPRVPFLAHGVPPLRRAPLLGEHNEQPDPVPRSAHPRRTPARMHEPGRDGERGGPLAGLRIVDLSMWWAGPYVTELCALMGAEVIKVESIQRVDGWRGGRQPDGQPPEFSHVFNGLNLNKLGITLDLASERGRELLRRLVERADALVENYSPRVMENLGLTDDVLLDWNPDLIELSMPAFGLSGPWRDFVGFAPTIEQLSGLCALTGYEGGQPVLSGHSVADPVAGLSGVLALLAALRGREQRGGGGQHVDLSQLEAMTALLGDAALASQTIGSTLARHGNAEPDAAPSGAYPAAGDDRWLVLSVATDTQWAALCAVIGQPTLAADTRFATSAARRSSRGALDGIVGAWTRRFEAADAADALQTAGIAAAPVYNPAELLADPHLNARGYFVELDREFVGRNPHPGLPFRFSGTPSAVRNAAPTLGQHNREVLGGILGVSATEFAALEAEQVIGTRPL